MPTPEASFEKIFSDYLNNLELRALTAGTNLTAICRELKISRSTPDRWRRATPRTVVIVDQLRESVERAEKKKLASASNASVG